MLKSNGPRMLPCGTPELTGSLVDRVVFIRTNWYREVTLWPLYLTDEIITQRGSLIKGPMATVGCKVGMYVRIVSTSVSILSLVLIATDRYFAIVFPLKSSILLSRRVRITALVATSVISMGYCFTMIYFSKVEDVGEERFCRFAWNDTGAIIKSITSVEFL